MKYGWIAVVAMMAALLSTGEVAAQEWGAEAAAESPAPPPSADVQKVEQITADQLKADETPKVTGFRPPGESAEPGMGTQAAERERARRSMGTVGESVRASGQTEDAIPLRFNFHGYYRARYNWVGNAPMQSQLNSETQETFFPTRNASYGYMRLRLDPEVTYGPNPDLPIARLRFTIDGFDNVVFGDNARVQPGVPLFAVEQSLTTVDGFDLKESLKLERAWIEFLVPIGQIRVGRMESQWGMGMLTHAGNGLAEWGDFLRGETFDRILFATRPITLARGISKGDTRQTPLIYAFVYDRLSQDPVVDSTIGSSTDGSCGFVEPCVGPGNTPRQPTPATSPWFKPTYTTFPERSVFPLAYLTNLDRRVSEIVNVLAWFDEDFGNGATDELFAGAYVVYRWQRSTESRIIIPDVSYRLKYTLKGKRRLSLYTEGEWHSIFGHSGTLVFTDPTRSCLGNAPCPRGEASIHNVLARFGVGKNGKWGTYMEGGWSSGDDDLLSFTEAPSGNAKLTARGFNQNIKVGMLMYQVALRALTWNALFYRSPGAEVLGANGSVWNSVYLMPVGRFTIVPGLELHGQVLVAWASALDPLVYGGGAEARVSNCKLASECFYGVEGDLALRAKIGARDIVWVDLEAGIMKPGQAFTNAGFSDALLWTTQLRAAMIF